MVRIIDADFDQLVDLRPIPEVTRAYERFPLKFSLVERIGVFT